MKIDIYTKSTNVLKIKNNANSNLNRTLKQNSNITLSLCCSISLRKTNAVKKLWNAIRAIRVWHKTYTGHLFNRCNNGISIHYNDVIMGVMASQITSLTIVDSTVDSGADQRKHQSSVWLAFVRGIHRWPVNSPHKRPVTRKMFPFDDVIMWCVPDELNSNSKSTI